MKGYTASFNLITPQEIEVKVFTLIWIEEGQIPHSYYQKPMASMQVLQAWSAMSLASKMDILVQEGSRRIRNCLPSTPWEEITPFLNRLMISMYWAKYPETVQRTLATRIVAKGNTNLENLRSLGRPIYRNKEERRKG